MFEIKDKIGYKIYFKTYYDIIYVTFFVPDLLN